MDNSRDTQSSSRSAPSRQLGQSGRTSRLSSTTESRIASTQNFVGGPSPRCAEAGLCQRRRPLSRIWTESPATQWIRAMLRSPAPSKRDFLNSLAENFARSVADGGNLGAQRPSPSSRGPRRRGLFRGFLVDGREKGVAGWGAKIRTSKWPNAFAEGSKRQEIEVRTRPSQKAVRLYSSCYSSRALSDWSQARFCAPITYWLKRRFLAPLSPNVPGCLSLCEEPPRGGFGVGCRIDLDSRSA